MKNLNPKDTPKLIISSESIHKLGATGYDIIILDEFETITQNFSGPTMKKLKLSHDHIRDKRYTLIHINTKKWNVELIGALRQGLKVYIPMFASAEMAEALHKELKSQEYQVKNFDMTFAHFRTLAGLTSNEAYQMLHRVRKLNQNVVYILTDLRSDNLPTDREDLLRFINYRCNIAEYPNLEEVHCDKIFTPDGRWIFKPNVSLETHLYNASRRNVSRNDFISLLTDRFSECGYNINIAEDCPSINSKLTENNEDKELLLQVRSIKKVLDTEKYSMIVNAQVLSDIEALDIRECLEREEDIDSAYRLALQKYNLASFYKKIPKDITEDFIKKYFQKRFQTINPLDDLRDNHKFMVNEDSREKKNKRHYYAIFGKKWRPHANYNPKYFTEFLNKLLKKFKVCFNRERDHTKIPTHLKLKIDRYLKKILPDACLSDNQTKIVFEMRDNHNYWKKERESMDEVTFLKYKQNFKAKMKVPTTSHKKEFKIHSLALIEYA
ncbi:hypothetical protein Glove_330g80 [Diversispora epigaea]|uniref:Uncharacterized protein n=1 Tax=Diversispora epigaea TaxID=1348612 RepID=A0A397HJE6_9GLOM|nr:hypothetical protein Glove_330g80 [Diversispora epigaea]